MNSFAFPLPRVRVPERARTGGKWYKERVWDGCLKYVRTSNAFPFPTPGDVIWQKREGVEQES